MKKFKFLFIATVLSCSFAEARNWQKILIPGAVCGDGQSYSVFLDRKSADKLLVEFMGGGACWSEDTCYGETSLTTLSPINTPNTSVIANEADDNPWSEHTALYIPYCTGDVHSGFHVASYKSETSLYHQGFTNFVLTLQYLKQQNILNFKGMKDVLLWGASAGALGALVHSQTLDAYLDLTARRTLIADSPGLHFGKNFWHKFSDTLNRNYEASFSKINLHYSLDDGFIAQFFGPVFLGLGKWEVGILQSTEDMVMSVVFGDITPEEHRKLVLSDRGISMIARKYPHVHTWITEGFTHTYLVKNKSAFITDTRGETAWNFALRVYGENEY
ncbi:MAG: pectin acetylesterase-family hydrolase [Pseudobdellovibrionaceae bacterium]